MLSIAVIGASLAGLNAAATLRAEGFAGRLVVIGDERHMPYDRPPLSKELIRGDWAPEQATLAIDPALGDVEWRLGVAATALDAASRTLTLSDGISEAFDGIVIATGATPRRLPGDRLSGVHEVRTLEDAAGLAAGLASANRLVVIGGGFIGQEVAASARKLGREVIMVESIAPAAHVVGQQIGAILADLHRSRGVDVRLGVAAAALEGEQGQLRRVHLSDGTAIDTTLAVVGIGVTPNTGWLEGSGLTIDNGVLCDETCLAAPGIVAAGDVARWPNQRYGELRRVEHWDNAARQGRHAALRLLAMDGASYEPYRPVPWFWSDQYGLKLQLVGSPVGHDEMVIVHGSAEQEKLVALYRRGDRLVAALGLASTARLLRYRRMLEDEPMWEDALAAA